jgi:chemotaxis protein MotB
MVVAGLFKPAENVLARRKVVEDPVSHERWLVSYADFITLLFAFFVVMYSISQVNESKYRILSDTLTEAFRLENSDIEYNKVSPELTIDPFQVGEQAKATPSALIELNEMPIPEQQKQGEGGGQEGDRDANLAGDFDSINDRIEKEFGNLIEKRLVTTRGNEEWLEIELSSTLLFDSGSADLNVPSLELLGEMAELFKEHENPIRVEGFTDNQPIRSGKFPSNWELSAARAAAVVQLFIEEGIAPQRLAAVGYGEHQPIADNRTLEGREKNRRVVLMVSKTGRLRPSLPVIADDQSLAEPQIPEPVILPEQLLEELIPAEGDMEGVITIEQDDGSLLFTSEKDPQQ